MTNVFISYSSKDEKIATWLHSRVTREGIETFMAEHSIEPGAIGDDEIWNNLKSAKWVFYIASKNAKNSNAVQQELGGAIMQNKIIIPILIDITPEELHPCIRKYQAIDIKKSPQKIYQTIREIAKTIQNNKLWAGILITVVIALIVLYICFSRKK